MRFRRRLSLGTLVIGAGVISCALGWFAPVVRADFQGSAHMMPFDEDAIAYGKTPATGAVARLQERINKGEVNLVFDERYGYLTSVLEALKIPRSSQMLVFSKTSFQRDRISPHSPRSLFFNDEVYVGFIPGAPLLELSTSDPKLGGVFYTLDQVTNARPRFVRQDQCLECHASAKTMGVPGQLVRSFATDDDGIVDLASGISLVDHRTPLADRWGGWYVTGEHGNQTHRGNLIGKAAFALQEKTPNYRGNLSDLGLFFDVHRYAAPSSDIVALMVLEHQTHMENFLTRLHYETTLALQTYGHIKYLKNVSESFLKYMLFTEEASLTSEVKGSSSFTQDFAARGPRDRKGRSLRDFDLRTRLFKFPCSYLIYSEAFNQLPGEMREQIYKRLWEILNGQDAKKEYASLTPETRRAIIEILRETKPGLPAYWMPSRLGILAH